MRYPKAVSVATKELDERKAENVVVVDVKDRTPFTDYYVIATAPNVRALGAFADYLSEAFEKAKLDVRKIEGTPESGWVLVDEGSVIVHLFTVEKRGEFNLDDLLKK